MRIAFALGLSLLLTGCAYTTAVHVKPGDTDSDGIRVFLPKPILVVTPENASIVYIPDPSREYAVRFGAFLTKNKTTLEIDGNGTLKKVEADLDGTITKDLLDFAKALLPTPTPKAMSENVTSGAASYFGVFEFVFTADGKLTGLNPITPPASGWMHFKPAAEPAPPPADGTDDVAPGKKKKKAGT